MRYFKNINLHLLILNLFLAILLSGHTLHWAHIKLCHTPNEHKHAYNTGTDHNDTEKPDQQPTHHTNCKICQFHNANCSKYNTNMTALWDFELEVRYTIASCLDTHHEETFLPYHLRAPPSLL